MVYLAIDSHFRQSNEWVKQEILGRWETIDLTNPRETYYKITSIFHEGITAGLDFTPYAAAIKFAKLIQPLHAAYISIHMPVMDNTSSTLESIWPSVVSTGNLLMLTAPSLQHAHNAPAHNIPLVDPDTLPSPITLLHSHPRPCPLYTSAPPDYLLRVAHTSPQHH